MANLSLFPSARLARRIPAADIRNDAGGTAYAFGPQHALAQLATTGCLNGSFYASAEDQLDRVLNLCRQLSPEFIAKTAIYAREVGAMKDMPALLCAWLSLDHGEWLERSFPRAIDSPRVLRSFVQILRSGALGRRSLGSRPKRLIRQWLEARDEAALFRASVGQQPSLADIVRMVHPRPATAARDAFYGYLLHQSTKLEVLPEVVQHYERFRRGECSCVPDVPFALLSAHELDTEQWCAIAKQAPWQTLRMNLNTFLRHGVFEHPDIVQYVARKLSDAQEVRRARPFPHQLLVATLNAAAGMPAAITRALEQALEYAVESVPSIEGRVYVMVDVSGSMRWPLTGHRRGSSSAVTCLHAAALIAAMIRRRNPQAEILPFHDALVRTRLPRKAGVLETARRLARLPGGATDCSAPLRWLNRRKREAELLIYVSDNESWLGRGRGSHHAATLTMQAWDEFRARQPQARLVCLDLQPNLSTQAPERDDILNLGGFSESVFSAMRAFAQGNEPCSRWVEQIAATRL